MSLRSKTSLIFAVLLSMAVCATGAFLLTRASTGIPTLSHQSSSERTFTLLPIQIRQNGFLPGEITKPSGDFEFLIINASGEHDITLRLERERGEHLQALSPKRGRNLRKVVSLSPGIYFLRVVDHPEWVCRLTITDR